VKVAPADRAFYEDHGFLGYPETMRVCIMLASPFVLDRKKKFLTCFVDLMIGNTTYQDWSYDAFLAINKACRPGSGFTGISDVSSLTGGTPDDNQPSFWVC
jgi:hypothetical protein